MHLTFYSDINSIVGVYNSHTVSHPHMPLGIDIVVGAGIYRTK